MWGPQTFDCNQVFSYFLIAVSCQFIIWPFVQSGTKHFLSVAPEWQQLRSLVSSPWKFSRFPPSRPASWRWPRLGALLHNVVRLPTLFWSKISDLTKYCASDLAKFCASILQNYYEPFCMLQQFKRMSETNKYHLTTLLSLAPLGFQASAEAFLIISSTLNCKITLLISTVATV